MVELDVEPLDLPEGIAMAWPDVTQHCQRLTDGERQLVQRQLDYCRHQLTTQSPAERHRLLAEMRDLEWSLAA